MERLLILGAMFFQKTRDVHRLPEWMNCINYTVIEQIPVLIHLMSEYRRRSAKGGQGTHLLTVNRNGAGSWNPYMNMEIAGN